MKKLLTDCKRNNITLHAIRGISEQAYWYVKHSVERARHVDTKKKSKSKCINMKGKLHRARMHLRQCKRTAFECRKAYERQIAQLKAEKHDLEKKVSKLREICRMDMNLATLQRKNGARTSAQVACYSPQPRRWSNSSPSDRTMKKMSQQFKEGRMDLHTSQLPTNVAERVYEHAMSSQMSAVARYNRHQQEQSIHLSSAASSSEYYDNIPLEF